MKNSGQTILIDCQDKNVADAMFKWFKEHLEEEMLEYSSLQDLEINNIDTENMLIDIVHKAYENEEEYNAPV